MPKLAYLPKNSNYQSGLVISETSVKSVKEKERQICILNEMTQSRKHEILTATDWHSNMDPRDVTASLKAVLKNWTRLKRYVAVHRLLYDVVW